MALEESPLTFSFVVSLYRSFGSTHFEGTWQTSPNPEEQAMKAAVIVLSDPSGGEEALGRVFNALAATYDFKRSDQEVELVFQGAGTRWTGVLTKADHPAHALYEAVADKVAGASLGCAAVFGARDAAEASGFKFIKDNPVPGTPGLASLAKYVADGYTVLTF
jgi:hypothetical protein